jgi:hypothetical protein
MTEIVSLTQILDIAWRHKSAVIKSMKWTFSHLEERRILAARELLIEELKQGDSIIVDAEDVDNFVAITHRYFRAAEEGAARLNIRLMAQVIAGQKLDGRLSADEFLQHAEVLASLSVKEIALLGIFYAKYQELLQKGKYDNDAASEATQHALRELVPVPFENTKELMASAHAITRTGLLLPHPGAIGGPIFEPTILLDRLYRLANLQDAVRKEAPQTDRK